MIVREHLGTLLIAGEREREREREMDPLSEATIVIQQPCFTRVEVRINVFADSINAELEVQLNGPCPDYAQIMCR